LDSHSRTRGKHIIKISIDKSNSKKAEKFIFKTKINYMPKAVCGKYGITIIGGYKYSDNLFIGESNVEIEDFASLADKESFRTKNIPNNKIEEEIEDIAGIRIICQFAEDIQKVVSLIKRRDGYDLKIVEERDYITNTKPSGYRSYHVIIKYPINSVMGYREILAEIQIRTMAMNFWAVTEHSLKYKYKGNLPDDLKQRLINCAEAAFNLDNEMSTIRNEIAYALRINKIKDNLIAGIIDNIQNLYFMTKQHRS
jgi:putative GTP pyrophosphokinase